MTTNEYFNDEPVIQFIANPSIWNFNDRLSAEGLNYVLGITDNYLNNYKRSSVQYSDNEVLVEVEAPRFKRNEINLLLRGEFLTVEGARKTADDEQNTFTERIWVGEDINNSTASARLTDGVLYVTLPKTEQSKGKQILISE